SLYEFRRLRQRQRLDPDRLWGVLAGYPAPRPCPRSSECGWWRGVRPQPDLWRARGRSPGAGLDPDAIRPRPTWYLDRMGWNPGSVLIRRALGDLERGFSDSGARQRCLERESVLGQQIPLRGQLRRLQQHGGDLP